MADKVASPKSPGQLEHSTEPESEELDAGDVPPSTTSYEEMRAELLKVLNEHHKIVKNRKTLYKR